jgi:acyl-CoA synthetase (AMP-forming)/AMP-acid ligase II
MFIDSELEKSFGDFGALIAAWGETPVGFVRLTDAAASPDSILARVNGRLGKTQRISVLYTIDEMPRSHIGKLLKTDLRALAAEKQNGR